MKRISQKRGFTMIELMIVVVIIGILAALAIPKFMISTYKSRQSEAKAMLKQVYEMQRAYRQQYDDYWGEGTVGSKDAPNAFSPIGVEIPLSARYTYTINVASKPNLLITAEAQLDDDATIDAWTIDQDGVLQVIPGRDDAIS